MKTKLALLFALALSVAGFVIILMGLFNPAHADNADLYMHPLATASITSATYAACRVAKGEKLPCAVLGASTAMLVGIAKELKDGSGNSMQEHTKDMGMNILGIGIALPLLTLNF